jgi:Protein of unknown function (DUF2939)
MLRIIGLAVVLMLGFYVAWPAWSGYRIKSALDTQDAALLSSKIDFDRVRTSLKPAVTAAVDAKVSAEIARSGAANEALLAQIKTQVMPKLVDNALATVVTPESILRIYREGGDPRQAIARIVAEKMGAGVGAGLGPLAGLAGAAEGAAGAGPGGLGKIAEQMGLDPGKVLGGFLGKKDPAAAPAAAPATAAAPVAQPAPSKSDTKPAFGMSNIKSFSVNGPLGFSLGVAKAADAADPDVTGDMAFTGGDWKLVGLRPKI